MSSESINRVNRVLLISEHFPPAAVGGTATYVHNLSRGLAKLGWEVYLVTQPAKGAPRARWYSQDGIQIYRLDIPDFLTKDLLFPRSFPLYLVRQIRRIVTQLRPDIIHFAAGWYPLVVTRLSGEVTQRPLVWTIHNLPPAEHHLGITRNERINHVFEKPYFKAVRGLSRLSLRFYKYERIVAVSDATADKIACEGVPRNKIRVIPNGVDIAHFGAPAKDKSEPPEAQLLVLTVAGIIEHKGQLNIVRAAPEVLAKFPAAVFLLVGPVRSKHYLTLLEETIRELKLESKVRVTGEVSSGDLLNFYQLCDLYLQPSLEEGFCLTMLEAMACGKPVIGTSKGEMPKLVVESGGGILISDSKPAEIAAAVARLLASEEMRKHLGQKAREYVVANYSWEAVARQTAELYREVIAEKARE